jgi:lanthanide-dependent methanol dehydrogenase
MAQVGRAPLSGSAPACRRRARALAVAALLCAAALQAQVAPSARQTQQTSAAVVPQIDARTVSNLTLAFSYRSGARGAQQGAPVIAGSTLFLLTPFPHALLAVDLNTQRLAWRYVPESDPLAGGLVCCERHDHGPVLANGRVYFTTLDGRVVAVDAQKGTLLWSERVADTTQGESLTSPPTLAGDRLVVGSSGDDFGARGWIAQLDAATGKLLWKYFSTGPDEDVGIQRGFTPVDTADRTSDAGSSTWSSQGWQHGGGSVSAPVLYDGALGMLIHATGPPAPWNPDQRSGRNRWTSGLFARDAQSGRARWFTALHSHNAYAWVNDTANIAVDREWQGVTRPLLIHPDADGRIYVLDRRSGMILAADPLIPNPPPRGVPRTQVQIRGVCPAWIGAVAGDPALSAAGVVYVPLSRLCMDIEPRDANYVQGTPFIGANVRVVAQPGRSRGGLIAWDPVGRRALWRIDEAFPLAGDVLATPGGVVFYGTLEGFLKAVDASNGRLLWQFKTHGAVTAKPVTFRGNDGHAYLAVVSGGGGPYGLAREYWIDHRDVTAVRGLAAALTDVPIPADPHGTLYVFRLP